MAATLAQAESLSRSEQAARAQVAARLDEYARALWGSLGSWRDEDVARFVATIVPRVLAGQRTVAGLTDAYLASVTGAGRVPVVDVTAVRGVDPVEVYRRPAVEMRSALAQGEAFPAALAASTARLASLVATDLQMAHREQARASMRAAGVQKYRRTLTGRENCALCMIASTQRYHVSVLLPIHPGCDCGVATFDLDGPDRQVIDFALLKSTHSRVEEFAGFSDPGARYAGLGSGRDYTKLIVIREHGEYGPTLAWRSDRFTGPSDI